MENSKILPNRKPKVIIFVMFMIFIITLFSLNLINATCIGVGGTLTNDGAYCVHTFTNNGTLNLTSPFNVPAKVLIIAGGGSGGISIGGGGGAGGLIYTDTTISSNTSIKIGVGGYSVVRSGGAQYGINGQNSSFGILQARGGGGGGSESASSGGQNGGSGGGGSARSFNAGGSGTSGQGFNGGIGNAGDSYGGGGGGSSQAGEGSTVNCHAGAGGNGTGININGTNVSWAGGGGGSADQNCFFGGAGFNGTGGNGGGGAGGWSSGFDATTNTGGGGGGGRSVSDNPADKSGAGGSGIVIVRYLEVLPTTFVINNPLNNSQYLTGQNITFNISATAGSNNIASIGLYINNTLKYYALPLSTPSYNLLVNVSDLTIGNYEWYVEAYDTSSNGFTTGNYSISVVDSSINSVSYNPIVSAGITEYYYLNLTTADNLDYIRFHYNNTLYNPNVISYGNNYLISNSVLLLNYNLIKNNTFFWTYGVNGKNYTTSNYSQIVNPLNIDNCTLNHFLLYNFTMKDQEQQYNLNGTGTNTSIDFTASLYSTLDLNTPVYTYSNSFKNLTNIAICINSTNIGANTFSLYSTTRFSQDGYSAQFYNVQNYLLNNQTGGLNISLLDLKLSQETDFIITYKNKYYQPVSGALINIQRKYIGENTFKSVEIPTTDSNGKTTGHFDRNSVIYTIIVSKDGTILATYSNVAVICNNILIGDCQINLNEPSGNDITDFNTVNGISYQMSYNKDTRLMSLTFFKVNGLTTNIELNTYDIISSGDILLCTNSVTSSSGTISCNIPANYNGTFKAVVVADNQQIAQQFYEVKNDVKSIFGYEGYIFIILLLLTVVFMFIGSPVMMVIGAIIGMIIALVLGFYNGGNVLGTTSALIWLIIAGGIIIYKLTNKGDSTA